MSEVSKPAHLSVVRVSSGDYGEVMLEKIKSRTSRMISRSMLDTFKGAELNVMVDDALEGLIVSLEALVLGEKTGQQSVTVTFRHEFVRAFPSSPWQFAKERWAPAWFRRRFPVDYQYDRQQVEEEHVVSLDHFEMFPAANIRTPEKYSGPLRIPYDRLTYEGRR